MTSNAYTTYKPKKNQITYIKRNYLKSIEMQQSPKHIPKYNKPIHIVFENDMNVAVALDFLHPLLQEYAHRVHSEPLFRRISSYLLTNVCNTGSTILDCGAWIGDNVIPWAKQHKDKHVFAFDPSSRNCQHMQYLAGINGLSNVHIYQVGLSDKDEILSTDDDLEHCSFTSGDTKSNKIQAVALDSLFHKKTISNVSFIHMDVEGMEWNVVRGAEQLIRNERPIVAYEIHVTTDKYIDEIKTFFKRLDYKVFLINEELPGCLEDCRNCIALPKEVYDKLNLAQMIISQNLPVDILIEQ
jgi:FkbM family methyltransferase